MRSKLARYISEFFRLAPLLQRTGAVISGEAAAHVHLLAATGTMAEQAPRYAALAPRRLDAIFPTGADEPAGVEADRSAVAEVLRHRLELYSTTVELSGGVRVTTLRREAVMAQLLGRGGLVLGLAGSLLRLANDPPIDVDEVREVLKAARLGDRFQPLLELLQVA